MRPFLRAVPIALALLAVASTAASRSVFVSGEPGGPGEDGETVTLSDSEIVSGSDPAELLASARGGAGGIAPEDGSAPAGDGGNVRLGPIFAASDTGEVTVSATGSGGNGGNGRAGAAAGAGASVRLHDAVDGETAGELLLSQFAQGGAAGNGPEGRAGDAVSRLRRSKAAESFTLISRSLGGTIGLGGRFAIDGGSARSAAQGGNRDGELTVVASAQAGPGSFDFTSGGDGGDASVLAFGRTEGDGQPVKVGAAPPLVIIGSDPPRRFLFFDRLPAEPRGESPAGAELSATEASAGLLSFPGVEGTAELESTVGFDPGTIIPPPFPDPIVTPILQPVGAFAGSGGGLRGVLGLSPAPAGNGGDAKSLSVGIARGDSPVEVRDVARGGVGGGQLASIADEGARGGGARSWAMGVGAGSAPVDVSADAYGGGAGNLFAANGELPPEIGGGIPGGEADASAVATSQGAVDAQASARAGVGTGGVNAAGNVFGPRWAPGGPATAIARASGDGGEARATAASNSATLAVEAAAAASVLRHATVESRIGAERRRTPRRRGRGARGRDAFVEAMVSPRPREVAELLRGETVLPHSLAGVDRVAALGRFSSVQRQWSRGQSVVSTFELALSSLDFVFDRRGEEVFISLFDPRLRRFGFESLHVTLEKGHAVLLERSFDDAREALRFLDGAVLEVGTLGQRPTSLQTDVPGAGGSLGRPSFLFLGPERATLRIEVETRFPGAGLALRFAVATEPVATP